MTLGGYGDRLTVWAVGSGPVSGDGLAPSSKLFFAKLVPELWVLPLLYYINTCYNSEDLQRNDIK